MSTTNHRTQPFPIWVIALLLVAILPFAGLMIWALVEFVSIERAMVIYRLENETSRLASTLYFEKLRALAQLTVAVLGAAWALLTLADTKVEVKGWPAVSCFTLANLSFAFSLWTYVYGYDFIVERMFHHATFDIDAPLVTFVNNWQHGWFVMGCVYLVFTVFIGRRVP